MFKPRLTNSNEDDNQYLENNVENLNTNQKLKKIEKICKMHDKKLKL